MKEDDAHFIMWEGGRKGVSIIMIRNIACTKAGGWLFFLKKVLELNFLCDDSSWIQVKNRQKSKPAGQTLVLFLHGTDQKTTSLALLHEQIKTLKPNEQSRIMRSGIFRQLLCPPNFPTCSLTLSHDAF
jgi:hypothetical protein